MAGEVRVRGVIAARAYAYSRRGLADIARHIIETRFESSFS